MKRYLFISTDRKNRPVLEFDVQAESPEEAIKGAKLFPYVYPDDFYDEHDKLKTEEEAFESVKAYYGLVEGKDPWDCGNGPDGYRTILIELGEAGVSQIVGNH